MNRAVRLAGAHWYVPAFVAIIAAVWVLARTPVFMAAGGEAALLVDLCLTAPALYALCYGRKQPLKVTLMRGLAIACAGVWLANRLIPVSEQVLLHQLTPLRWVALVLIALFELRLVVAAVRVAFSANGTVEDVRAASGAPPLVARIMLWEARFWRAVWRLVSGRAGRKP